MGTEPYSMQREASVFKARDNNLLYLKKQITSEGMLPTKGTKAITLEMQMEGELGKTLVSPLQRKRNWPREENAEEATVSPEFSKCCILRKRRA